MGDKVVAVPGIGNIQFPAGMADAEINTAIEQELAKRNPKPNLSAMRPQDLAAQAMQQSGISGQQQLAPSAPRVNMQEQSNAGSYAGNVANSTGRMMGEGGKFLKAFGQDAGGQAQGSGELIKNVLTQGGGSLEGNASALGSNLIAPLVQSAKDPKQSTAETMGQAMGVNSKGIKDAALQGDTSSILGHSVLPLATAMIAARGAKQVAPSASDLGIPTRAHASQLFSEVGDAIGDNRIQVGGAAGDAALKIQEMSKRGFTMPKPVADFVRRMTDKNPDVPSDLSYEEARDFASNASNLTREELKSMKPKMKAAVGDFASKMNDSIAQAADEAGKKAEYLDAMGEYASASQWRNRAALLGKVIAKTSAVGAGLYGANKVGSELINGR